MKKILLIFLLGTPLAAVSQQINAKDEIATVMKNLLRALESPTKENLLKFTHQDLSYGHSNARVETQEQFMSALLSGQSDFVSITPENEVITVVGNTATVRHILHATTLDAGKSGEVHLPVLYVWIKEQNTWKLLARQAVKLVNQ